MGARATGGQRRGPSRLVSGVLLPEEPALKNWPAIGHCRSRTYARFWCAEASTTACACVAALRRRRFGRFWKRRRSAGSHRESSGRPAPSAAGLLLAPPRPNTESEYRERCGDTWDCGSRSIGRDRLSVWVSERMADGEAPSGIASQAEKIVAAGAMCCRAPPPLLAWSILLRPLGRGCL